MPNFSDSMNYDENIMLLFNVLQPPDHAAWSLKYLNYLGRILQWKLKNGKKEISQDNWKRYCVEMT